MSALLEVILPVFLVIGAGWLAVWRGYFSDGGVEGLTRFTQNFAIPCLIFKALATLDLGADFDPALLGSFYAGAIVGFGIGLLGARLLFGRPWEDAVAIGFCCLFSNTVLLGLPITERAYGAQALAGNYAIIALHAPICYTLGITLMEVIRNRGANLRTLLPLVLGAVFRNALILGILLGVFVNLASIPVPGVLMDAVDLVARAALPTALFALGGVLYRYRPEGDAATIAMICIVSLVVHPAVVWILGTLAGLDRDSFRSAVLTASMAPGINTYLFANMYGVAKRVSASGVLIGTAASVLSIWIWLTILP